MKDKELNNILFSALRKEPVADDPAVRLYGELEEELDRWYLHRRATLARRRSVLPYAAMACMVLLLGPVVRSAAEPDDMLYAQCTGGSVDGLFQQTSQLMQSI